MASCLWGTYSFRATSRHANMGVESRICVRVELRNAMDSVRKPPPRDKALQSWKEIALYLRSGVLTVQRWHHELQLPVRKIGPGRRSPVIAFPSEIDQWMRDRPVHKDMSNAHFAAPFANTPNFELQGTSFGELANQSAGVLYQFLQAELESGFTRISIATTSNSSQKRFRNLAEARKAYDAALHWLSYSCSMNQAPLTANQLTEVNSKLKKLEEQLRKLGEPNLSRFVVPV